VLAVLPFVYLSKTVSQPYNVPMSSDYFHVQDFEVSSDGPVTQTVAFNKGDFVNIRLSVYGFGEEILFVVSANSKEYIRYQGPSGVDENFTTPVTANYTFTYSKPYFSINRLNLDIIVTTFWTMTAYSDVVEDYPTLPFQVLYFGAGLVIAGTAISVYGIVKKGKIHQQTLKNFLAR
jgi:hypothetical protein